MVKFKIGDSLYCYNPVINFTIGKYYIIDYVNNNYTDYDTEKVVIVVGITNDKGGHRYFVVKGGELFYLDYFYTEKEYRKAKLERISWLNWKESNHYE